MIITSHMQKLIQIYPRLLKLSHKQESVTDGQTEWKWDGQMDGRTDGHYYYIPHRFRGGIIKWFNEWLLFNAKWAIFQLYHYHGINKLHLDEMMMFGLSHWHSYSHRKQFHILCSSTVRDIAWYFGRHITHLSTVRDIRYSMILY
jgi:hypothetical protein